MAKLAKDNKAKRKKISANRGTSQRVPKKSKVSPMFNTTGTNPVIDFNTASKNPIFKIPKGYEGTAIFQTLPFSRFECPKYHPEKWQGEIEDNNNCYNYALDLAFDYDSTLQPGELALSLGKVSRTSVMKNPFDFTHENYAKHLINLAELDGLKYLGVANIKASPGRRLVALAIPGDPNEYDDFHWYRMDKDGGWSHKPGPKAVRKLEPNVPVTIWFQQNMLTLMTPPHVTDLGRYSRFVGYFEVPEKGLKFNKKRLKNQFVQKQYHRRTHKRIKGLHF